MVCFLSGVCWFILIIGWINYINLSTAKVTKQAHEVGIKKVLGASRAHLVIQFITEAFMVNILAAVLGLIIFIVGVDYFNKSGFSYL
jgi:putative ABC transport system permease protein